jgi:exonuclease SbcD
LNEFPLIGDQRYILDGILRLAADNRADGILIAGDVYDKGVPSVEAVELFDDFITAATDGGIAVYAVSGNHDSPERMDFGSRIMRRHNVHIAGEFGGAIECVRVQDGYGALNVWLMPYLRPAAVNKKLGIQTVSFGECVRAALDAVTISTDERNILVAHQFVTAGGVCPETSDSETKRLGGTDNVDASLFDAFDYAALGHIHRPQRIGRDTVRYAGSPLKYSFSECNDVKGATLLEIKAKGDLTFEKLPLAPLRDMCNIRCALSELSAQTAARDAYVRIILTDEGEIIDPIGKVREVYPNTMSLEFDNARTRARGASDGPQFDDIREKSPLQLFEAFFAAQNGAELSDAQREMFAEAVKTD